MESQSHGLEFEDRIIRCVTGLSKKEYDNTKKDGGYVSSMDIVAGNRSERNYSIKTCRDAKNINCADITRFMQHCRDTEFTMIVGAWRQSGNYKIYYKILEFDFHPSNYQKIWGKLDIADIRPFVEYVRSIPNGRAGQISTRSERMRRKDLIVESTGDCLAKINPKVDSGTQRRVQCSMQVDKLKDSGIPYREYDKTYMMMEIPYEQESGPRIRSI